MTAPERRTADVAVRQAVRADLLDIFRIEKVAFPQPWPFSAFERFLDEPGFLVACDPDATGDGPVDGSVVGYIVADCVDGHGGAVGHVKDVAVDPDRRGEGVGSTLLCRGMEALEAQGADTVKLEVRRSNHDARSLYATFGFDHLHTVSDYYYDDEDALVLVRPLGKS